MALTRTEVFVDPALAADSGRGTRATITLAAATFNLGALTLNETNAFTAYNTLGFAAGDRIYLSGGTAVTVGFHAIASITSNSEIVLVADITSDASSPTDVTSDSAPFGDLKYAIEQTTFDLTNGTRVDIKAGTDEVLTVEGLETTMADTVTTVAWVPDAFKIVVFQGYTTVAGDGGIGGISGNGARSIMGGALQDFISFIDIHAHNCGSAAVFDIDNACNFINVEVDNTSGAGISTDDDATILGCYIHNVGGNGITGSFTHYIAFNFIENGANDVAIGIFTFGESFIERNILKLDGASDGISLGTQSTCNANSIWSDGGTGNGIQPRSPNIRILSLSNNLVEGFSGAGGTGIDLADQTGCLLNAYIGNALYNNTTEYVVPAGNGWILYETDNETLSATPFTDATNGDFSPVDTGNVKEGALPADFGNGQ